MVKFGKIQHCVSPVVRWLQTQVKHQPERDTLSKTEAPLKQNSSTEPTLEYWQLQWNRLWNFCVW